MQCYVPFCTNSTGNNSITDGLNFHVFPSDAILRNKWLEALGRDDFALNECILVCSQHFLDEDFCFINGIRQIRPGAIPCTVKVCMICLDTDAKLVSLGRYNLDIAYKKLTGCSMYEESNVKQTLCIKCAQRLKNFERFRTESLRARAAMMELVKIHRKITMCHINQIKEEFKSNIYMNLKENENLDGQTKLDEPSQAIDAFNIKSDVFDDNINKKFTLDDTNENVDLNIGSKDTAVNGEKHNAISDFDERINIKSSLDDRIEIIDLKIENIDTVESEEIYIKNNNEEADAFDDRINMTLTLDDTNENVDIKIENEDMLVKDKEHISNGNEENQRNENTVLEMTIKMECSVCLEVFTDKNAYYSHIVTHECTCVECNTQLSEHTDSSLRSQHNESNQVWRSDNSADYPHPVTQIWMGPMQNLCKTTSQSRDIYPPTKSTDYVTLDTINKTKITQLNKNEVSLTEIVKDGATPSVIKPQQEYYCEHCKYKCNKRTNLLRHMKSHTGVKRFACNLCEYACGNKTHFSRHLRVHTGEKPFVCKLCGHACVQKNHLLVHMRIHTGEKPFSCKSCQYAARKREDLVRHMRIHTGEKPFSCHLCEFACNQKNNLANHMRLHTGEKPFSCKLCEYACRQKVSLINHMKTHTPEKPYTCDLCEYATRKKGDLESHMRIHTGEKPFSCRLCPYTFRRKQHLISHMRIHTGEKPFSCDYCEYACNQKSSLIRHTKACKELKRIF